MFDMKKEGENILSVTLSGTLTADEVTAFYDWFTPALNAADQVGLVIDMTGFDDMTGDAIRRDIPLELGLLDKLGKVPKLAIISDKEFVGALAGAVNPLVPMVEVKVFSPVDREKAFAFASELPSKKPTGKGARLIDSPSADVVAFEIDGYIDDDEMEAISTEINTRINRGTTFSALARFKSFGGFDPEILTEGSFFKMKVRGIKSLKKYAVITDESWLKAMIGFAGTVTGIDIRHFPLAEEQAAWEWVKA